MATETLRPNGNSQTELINSSDDDTNNYTYVDESVTNDSDYVRSGTSAAWVTDLYALPDTAIPAGSTINSITFYARFREGDGGNDYAKFAYKSGGTVYYSSAPNITTSFTTYSWVQNTNQKTSAAWTIDDINALTAGISLYWAGGAGAPGGWCSQFWLVIDYGWTHITKINGIASANISKINGIPVANISKVNGVAV
jgi:hypothetical protein